MKWTNEEETRLRELHSEGLTFGEISKHLPGKERHACIGKAHRMKLDVRKPAIKEKLDKVAKPKNVSKVKLTKIPEVFMESKPLKPWEFEGSIYIMQLNERTCRWPGDNKTYCGMEVESHSYCSHHKKLAYRQKAD